MGGRPVRIAALAVGMALGLARVGPAQGYGPLPTPLPPSAPGIGGQLLGLADEMAARVNQLAGSAAQDYAQVPGRDTLLGDLRELARSVGDFRALLAIQGDTYGLQQAYGGLANSWHNLQNQLAPLAGRSPGADAAVARLAQIDAQIYQVLGLNAPSPGFSGVTPPAAGVPDLARLADALVWRSRQLASVIPGAMGGRRETGALMDLARNLAIQADRFHDAEAARQPPDVVRALYGQVAAQLQQMSRAMQAGPPQVQQVWQGILAVDSQLQQALGPAILPGVPNPPPLPPPGPGPSPQVAALADQLQGQVDQFIVAFSPLIRAAPGNPEILADARRLSGDVARFRQAVAQGLDPGRLAFAYRDVDATWTRLWRRVQRVTRGRNGPFIEMLRELVATCGQLHQVLSMPGYSPGFN